MSGANTHQRTCAPTGWHVASVLQLRSLTRSKTTTFPLLVLILVLLLTDRSRADCYWPDGTENDLHQPCYTAHDGAIGLCCRSGDVCLSNGVCMVDDTGGQQLGPHSNRERDDFALADAEVYYRGSCTYRDWSKGKNCPTVCIKGSGIQPHGDVAMMPCPNTDNTEWYCGDSNAKKANCSSGAFIVSLPKPSLFTTIGVSPSKTADMPEPSSSRPASGSTTMAAVTTIATTPSNATLSTGPTGPTSGASPPTASTTVPGGSSPSSPVPSESPSPRSSTTVPLAVGIGIGGASLMIAGVLAFFLWRRRQQSAPAVAESPPPRNTPDDGLNPVLNGPPFRTGSILRQPSNGYLNGAGAFALHGGHDGSSASAADVLNGGGGHRSNSLHSGSILSNLTAHHANPHDRFGSDAVAMHDMRRTPPAGWGQGSRNDKIPELPYDGRRLAPYHGAPLMEHDGYSELPG